MNGYGSDRATSQEIVAEIWVRVADLREERGDPEGADRARRNAGFIVGLSSAQGRSGSWRG